MGKNLYPAACQPVLRQYAPLAHSLAQASGLSMDDLRQAIVLAWLEGAEPAHAVPASLGLRRLPCGWVSTDLHVNARRAETDEILGPIEEMPRPKARRGDVAAGVAADLGLGLRAAQKRLKRQRDAAGAGQGDLFMDGEE
mgnify:CR=1 FL=1